MGSKNANLVQDLADLFSFIAWAVEAVLYHFMHQLGVTEENRSRNGWLADGNHVPKPGVPFQRPLQFRNRTDRQMSSQFFDEHGEVGLTKLMAFPPVHRQVERGDQSYAPAAPTVAEDCHDVGLRRENGWTQDELRSPLAGR